MGSGIVCREKGKSLWITYECVGKGEETFITYELIELRESLEKAMKKMGIKMREIKQVTYCYEPLNINDTIKELKIPNGGVVTIQLKSTF